MLLAIVAVAFEIVGVLTAIHSVMNTRTPQGAVAWVVSLVTFPWVAVPAYWVLGRSRFQGYVTARQEGEQRIRHVALRAADEIAGFRSTRDEEDAAGSALSTRAPVANTMPFNITGYPALSVPCGKSQGLPIGLQLVAPYFKDDVLLRAAYTYQHSTDWPSIIQAPAATA